MVPTTSKLFKFKRKTRLPEHTTLSQDSHIGILGEPSAHSHPDDSLPLLVKAAAKSHIAADSASTLGEELGKLVGAALGTTEGNVDGNAEGLVLGLEEGDPEGEHEG